MIFDFYTLVICGVVGFIAILSPLINIFFRGLLTLKKYSKSQVGSELNHSGPKFSIVITAQDNEVELEKNLPTLFSQEYEPGFEVIVVTGKSEDETDSVLKRLQKEHDNLYTTFIPDSSRYMSRMKLAITLGVKAAKNEWIILLGAECQPATDQWLSTLATHCTVQKNLVLSYTNYEDDTKSYWRFHRLQSAIYSIREALGRRAYRSIGANVAFKKSDFMKHNGFLNNLKYERGEYDFIVNEYSEDYRTDVAIEPQAHIFVDTPSSKTWLNEHLYYMETRRHLARKIGHRFVFNTDLLYIHFAYLTTIAAITYFGIMRNWGGLGISAFAMILMIVLRTIFAKKVAKYLQEDINTFAVVPFELRTIWTQLYLKLRYLMTDKSDFIRK